MSAPTVLSAALRAPATITLSELTAFVAFGWRLLGLIHDAEAGL